MLGKVKRLIESFLSQTIQLIQVNETLHDSAERSCCRKVCAKRKLCANVICRNVWRHTQKKVSASDRGLTELVRKVFLWIDNMHRANCPFHYNSIFGSFPTVLFLDTALFLQVVSHRCRIKDSNNKSHSFVKTPLLTSDTSLNIWLALNAVILSLLVGLFELTRRYVQKTDTHK